MEGRPDELTVRREVGKVTALERDEIRALFEQRNTLLELGRALADMSREELEQSALYERLVKDLGDTTRRFQQWWDAKARKYGWDNALNGMWDIDFETCTIYLRTPPPEIFPDAGPNRPNRPRR